MFTKEYWNTRAEKYGHTGHSEPFYYCFDQQSRLYAINEIIKKIVSEKDTALDFGCGSGDFIALLSHHFKTIHGFDVSDVIIKNTKERFHQKNIIISDKPYDYKLKNQFDLILTVTVLQTFTKQELEEAILTLSQCLAHGGLMIVMEFFTNTERNLEFNEIKATHDEWLLLLQKNNLEIVSTANFANPHITTLKSWNSYNNNLFLKSLKLFKYCKFAQKRFGRSAEKLITQYKDVLSETESPLKIYTIQKKTHELKPT